MTLLLFLIAVFAIVCIARYNEDDRLFWKLFVSFTAAFVLTSVIVKTIESKQNKKDCIEQVCPTQSSNSALDQVSLFQNALNSTTLTDVTGPVAVSKDYALVTNTIPNILHRVWWGIRDQPPELITFVKIRDPIHSVGILDDS